MKEPFYGMFLSTLNKTTSTEVPIATGTSKSVGVSHEDEDLSIVVEAVTNKLF